MKAFILAVLFLAIFGAVGFGYQSLRQLEQRAGLLEETLPVVQQSVHELPNHQDLSQVEQRATTTGDAVETLKVAIHEQQETLDALAARTEVINQRLKEQGTKIETLITELAALKKTAAAAKPVVAKPAAAVAVVKPKPLTLPFDVVAVEKRGNETFLVIAPQGSTSLSSTRLFRAGDEIDGVWSLRILRPEKRMAVFVNTDGQTLEYRW